MGSGAILSWVIVLGNAGAVRAQNYYDNSHAGMVSTQRNGSLSLQSFEAQATRDDVPGSVFLWGIYWMLRSHYLPIDFYSDRISEKKTCNL